jgi:bifunctional DNase/RNase
MIPVIFNQLLFSNMGFVVILKEKTDSRILPIFIGAVEARAIALYNNNVQVPRPLTHDLLKNILDYLQYTVKRIEVCDLKEGTFYARLILEKNGDEIEIDSRPSDAIALALRSSAPMFVDEKVMEEAGRVMDDIKTVEGEKLLKESEHKEEMSPIDKLKSDLEKAVEEERYEDAARIRDEIKRLDDKNAEN